MACAGARGSVRSMGRPTKLTPELATALLDAIRLGVPLSLACDGAEVGIDTINEWIRRGENREGGRGGPPAAGMYVAFAAAKKKAGADAQARRIGRIEKAAK